ncbi:MAG TPA: hypothetical protein VEN81_02420 [Planctomycetota bacterium]|nr:hypothetical protein [Planctomycetota bacterium]
MRRFLYGCLVLVVALTIAACSTGGDAGMMRCEGCHREVQAAKLCDQCRQCAKCDRCTATCAGCGQEFRKTEMCGVCHKHCLKCDTCGQ